MYGRSAAIFGSGTNRFAALLSRSALLVCVFGLSVVFACARISEAPQSGLTWLRVAVSLVSIAIVVFAKRRNIGQRVVLAFALESAAGIAMFAYVDVPFVTSHDTQIANQVATSYANLTHRSIVNDLRELRRTR